MMRPLFCSGVSLILLAVSGFGQGRNLPPPPPRCLPVGPMPSTPGPLPPTNCPAPFRAATGPVPDTTAFRFLFKEVMMVEADANRRKAQGKDDTVAREHIRR